MKGHPISGFLLALALLCGVLGAHAQVPVPRLTAHIIDQTATLNDQQIASLEQTLQAFESVKGSQLAVLIVATTAPEAIEQYAIRVAEQWKLGRKKIDDGAILVVAKNDRTVRIEVGYGLEGALNDATSQRIISETITPRFKQGDFYGGIDAGVTQIIGVVNGEALPAPSSRSSRDITDIGQLFPIIFIVVLVVGGLLRSLLGRFPAALLTGVGVGALAWLLAGAVSIALGAGALALLFTLVGVGMGGRGLGGMRGGSGGGGFSGGGGGFGGGGASGRW